MNLDTSKRRRVVILGPASELHTGVHGALVRTPVTETDYYLPPHYHNFLAPTLPKGEEFNPYIHFSISEAIVYSVPETNVDWILHSSRLPPQLHALKHPWLADMDCLLATLTCGTAYALGHDGIVPAELSSLRQKYMLSHFLDVNCSSLLFRSEFKRSEFLSFVKERALAETIELEQLEEKSLVMRPTLPSIDLDNTPTRVPHIIFMGRTLEGKGGDVAAMVYRHLDVIYSSRIVLTWVGPVSINVSLPKSTRVYPVLHQEDYWKQLQQANVFFSPTEFEGYGIGMIEAARFGLAIVTSRGPGMEHIEEVFESGKNALFASSRGSLVQRSFDFEQCIRQLIDMPDLLTRISNNNLALFNGGPLDITLRDEILIEQYDKLEIGELSSSTIPKPNIPRLSHGIGFTNYLISAETLKRRQQELHSDKRVVVQA